ncbi:CBS domain-containing protein [Nevskia sp.]|uniref:CBS domain-containing protein n=1 Tax=Nevskia sp. TaxID=1929292 RepID=UPI0025E22EF5|nr:CBS domain-containing protein [Nevskia sp.]
MATLDSVKVRDYMTTKLVTFRPDMEVMHAVHTLVEKGISGAPVVDAKGNLLGVLSQRDCLEVALTAAQDSCIAGPVAQYMSEKPVTVDPETNLTQLATMFCTAPFRRYPVIENGQLVGQISRSDVLRAISQMC